MEIGERSLHSKQRRPRREAESAQGVFNSMPGQEIRAARDRNGAPGRGGPGMTSSGVFTLSQADTNAFNVSGYHIQGASQKGYSRYIQGWGTDVWSRPGQEQWRAEGRFEKLLGGHASSDVEINGTWEVRWRQRKVNSGFLDSMVLQVRNTSHLVRIT